MADMQEAKDGPVSSPESGSKVMSKKERSCNKLHTSLMLATETAAGAVAAACREARGLAPRLREPSPAAPPADGVDGIDGGGSGGRPPRDRGDFCGCKHHTHTIMAAQAMLFDGKHCCN